ncbi:phage terminase small subunit-related protein [Paenibacillus polymyxa]|uniref:phage terminase small subunit-related protein n=1 Tax=Paenibacillus polymyxa TaxID=1406 RepID=UPI0039904BA5
MARERSPERDKAKQMWLESDGAKLPLEELKHKQSNSSPTLTGGGIFSFYLPACPVTVCIHTYIKVTTNKGGLKL